jgi:gamma-polyglutamate biosynthesis protein CapA
MNRLKLFTVFAILFLTTGCAKAGGSLGIDESSAKIDDQTNSAQVQEEDATGTVLSALPYDAELYNNLFLMAKDVPEEIGAVSGAIVPHHIVGGYIPATLFKYLAKQNPSLIVIFGPNHFIKGGAKVISSGRSWQTPFGQLRTEKRLIQKLADGAVLTIDDETMKGEHSIAALVSYISRNLPDAKIAPFIFPFNTDTTTLDNFLQNLWPLLPDDVVFVSSIDFSHYQNPAMTDFHDELNRAVIKDFEYNRLSKMEIDSIPSLYLLLKSMERIGAQKIAYELGDNSAHMMDNPKLEETTSYYSPWFVKGEKSEDRLSSMLFFGDLMLDRSVKKQIDANGSDYIFSKLAGEENRFFMGMDLIHANLEGPFADSRRATSKEIAFRFDPILLHMLQEYNFGMFSQANNHTLDMSSAGYAESIKNLGNAGFDAYGAQYRLDDSSIKVKQVGNNTILFIGLNDTNEPVNMEKVKALILRGQTIDENLEPEFTVVNIHWGQEYKEISNTRQRELAHELIDAGADIVIGHHPHVVQEMEIYKDRPIFYSLGNFVFDQYFSVPTQQGLGIGIALRPGSITIYPTALEQTKSQVSQMLYDKRVKYLTGWIAKSRLGNFKYENNKILINI